MITKCRSEEITEFEDKTEIELIKNIGFSVKHSTTKTNPIMNNKPFPSPKLSDENKLTTNDSGKYIVHSL